MLYAVFVERGAVVTSSEEDEEEDESANGDRDVQKTDTLEDMTNMEATSRYGANQPGPAESEYVLLKGISALIQQICAAT